MATLERIEDLQHLAEQEARGGNPSLIYSQLLQGTQKLQASITSPAEKLFRMLFNCVSQCVFD